MQTWVSVTLKFDNNVCVDLLWWPKFLLYILELFSHQFWHKLWRSDFYFNFNLFWLSVGSPISPDVRPGSGSGRAKILSQFWAKLSKEKLFRMSTGCQKTIFQYVNMFVCQYVNMSVCQYVNMLEWNFSA